MATAATMLLLLLVAVASADLSHHRQRDVSVNPAGSAGGGLTGTYPSPMLAPTGVTPGTYAIANLTYNTHGFVTGAQNGTAVVSITAGTGLTGGPITNGTGQLSVAASGVTAATYGTPTTVAQVTVDAYGRITNAVNVPLTSSFYGSVSICTVTSSYSGTLGPGGIMVWSTVVSDPYSLFNSGGNYIAAPATGIYLVRATIYSFNTSTGDWAIFVNGSTKYGYFQFKTSLTGNFMRTNAVIQLNANDQVTIRCVSITIGPYNYGLTGNSFQLVRLS